MHCTKNESFPLRISPVNVTKSAWITSIHASGKQGEIKSVSVLTRLPHLLTPRWNFCLKKRLWYRCFPVNFAKFLRTPFFIEHLLWLLLLGFWWSVWWSVRNTQEDTLYPLSVHQMIVRYNIKDIVDLFSFRITYKTKLPVCNLEQFCRFCFKRIAGVAF